MADEVVVPVKSAWFSKINWTQAIAFLAMLVSYFGINVDPATQAAILAAITAISTIVTWIMKTFFTKSITPSSAAK